jgi:hypothetical protein
MSTGSAIKAGFGLAVLLLGPACFTRDETLVVRPDGSMEGDESDFSTGERLAAPPGWTSEQSRSVDNEGKPQIKAVWRAELSDVNLYPVTFADPADPHAASGLRTRTSLSMETFPDRIVYRFTRHYDGRHAGMYGKMRKDSVPAELEAKDSSALTPEERDKLLEGAGEYEALSRLLRARNALGRAAAEGLIPAGSLEPVIEDLGHLLENRLSLAGMQRIFSLPDEEQEAEERRLNLDVRGRLEAAFSPRHLPRLKSLLDREERDFEVMQDLSDDRLVLSVEMPGIIVEANTAIVRGPQASWEIAGEDIVNGDVVLTAVSVAPRDAAGR